MTCGIDASKFAKRDSQMHVTPSDVVLTSKVLVSRRLEHKNTLGLALGLDTKS